MRTTSWPDYVDWTPDTTTHNELEQLADLARHELAVDPVVKVSDPWPDDVWVALEAIRDRLKQAGLPHELARESAISWAILKYHDVASSVRFQARITDTAPQGLGAR